MKERLTKAKIEGYAPRGARYSVWDETLPGLCVRVQPTGAKAFYIYARTRRGEQVWKKIAEFGAETDLQQVRRWAAEELQKLKAAADDGPRRRGLTFATYAEEWHKRAENRKAKSKTAKRGSTIAEERRKLDKHLLPAFGPMRLAQIGRRDVDSLHSGMASSPVQANRTLSTLRALFNQAIDDGEIDVNPCRGVKMFPESPREVRLDAQQLEALGKVLNTPRINYKRTVRGKPEASFYQVNPYIAAAVELLAFTGCRRGEILGLAWADVDLDAGIVHLRETKTIPRDVILNSQARAVLDRLKASRVNDWVIPGATAEGHMSNFQKQWEILRNAAGMMDFPLHGFRHLFASVGADLGIADALRSELLGHEPDRRSVTARYTHPSIDSLRDASERIGEWISRAMRGLVKGANIIEAAG